MHHTFRQRTLLSKIAQICKYADDKCSGYNFWAERDLVSMVCITYILYKPGPVCLKRHGSDFLAGPVLESVWLLDLYTIMHKHKYDEEKNI